MNRKLTQAQIWAAPTALALLSAIGLLAALLSDEGIGDLIAWVVLALPVAVSARYSFSRER
jgi:hypothetical protein